MYKVQEKVLNEGLMTPTCNDLMIGFVLYLGIIM